MDDKKQENLDTGVSPEDTAETPEETQAPEAGEMMSDAAVQADEPSVSGSTSDTSSGGDKKSLQTIIIAVIIAAIAILFALEFTGTTDFIKSNPVVATVNGQEIREDDFQLRLAQILSSPQAQTLQLDDPTIRADVESQVLTEVVNTQLLLETAKAEGHTVTEEEAQAEYDAILERFASEELLMQELTNGGLTKETFLENIGDQLTIQKYLDTQINQEDLTVTDAEVQEFYDTVTEGQEGVPPLSEIRGQIEQQLLSQKEQVQISNVIDQLRNNADIEILREF